MKFYTYAKAVGSKIYYRGIVDGRPVTSKEDFNPSLFVKSKKSNTEWSSLYGDPLEEVSMGDIREYKDFIKRYEGVEGFEVHGQIAPEYQYLTRNFKGEIDYDVDQMKIMFLDIEVVARNGFPDVQSAADPIVLIACHDKASNKTIVFGYREHDVWPGSKYEYHLCKDEMSMLRSFIQYWQSEYPDIVSGWNSDKFDFPYIINRIMRLLGDEWAKKMSPFNMIHERMIEVRGGDEVQTYDIVGVNQIDYLDAYKKFGTYSAKESYALGFIAKEELGETKHEIEGAESFNDGYDNYYDQFVYYNAVDAQLVHKLDNKLKLIDLIVALSYLVKCNFKDTFGPVKMWDVFIYNHLMKKKVAVPPQSKKFTGAFEGAWCKDVVPGMYGWTMSFDFASLYPTIIRQWNISPETLIKEYQESIKVNDVVNCEAGLSSFAHENDYSIAANGSMYRKDKKGMLPELMEFLMVGRKTAKKEMLKLEQQYQKTKDESLLPKIAAKNALQLALKVAANAGYGACTNSGFRYYDLRIGEAITLSGQASDRHVEKSLNIYMNKLLKTEDIDYVIAGDTDSAYLNVDPIVKKVCGECDIDKIVTTLDKIGEQIQKSVIQKSIDHIFELCNCYEKLMDMKREAIASKVIWTAKKRYAMMVHNSEGVDYKPYKMKIMGLDIVKSSTPQAIRKVLKDSLPIIFEQGEIPLREYVLSTKAKFNELPVEEISFPRGVSDIDKWFDGRTYKKGTPIHVRAAILYNQRADECKVQEFVKNKQYDKIRNGDKIKFCYLKLPNPIREDIIGFPSAGELPEEFGLHSYLDKDLQFEKTFIAPLKGITDAIGWHLEEQSSLEDFFG